MTSDDWAHVDLGNQIDNSWNKDSALALKLGNLSFIIRIRESEKKEIEKKHIRMLNVKERKDRKLKRKKVIMIYSFLLYKLLKESGGGFKKVRLCRDINPPKDVYRFIGIICKYYNEPSLMQQGFKIRFKNDGKSRAHNLANKSYQGRRKEDYLIKDRDMHDLDKLLRKL